MLRIKPLSVDNRIAIDNSSIAMDNSNLKNDKKVNEMDLFFIDRSVASPTAVAKPSHIHRKRKLSDITSDDESESGGDSELEAYLLNDNGSSFLDNELEHQGTYEDENELVHTICTSKKKTEREPAWKDVDDTDEVVKGKCSKDGEKFVSKKGMKGDAYKSLLRDHFSSLGAASNDWASLDRNQNSSDSEDAENESLLMRSTGNYIAAPSSRLRKSKINICKVKALTNHSRHKGNVNSVEFHPSSFIALTAGADHRLSLVQVDGKVNEIVQNISIPKAPIKCAHFSSEEQQVIISSQQKRFHYFDMLSGKLQVVGSIKGINELTLSAFDISPDGKIIAFLGSHGRIHILSAKTKEYIDTLKMNGAVNALCFSSDSEKMYSFGGDSEVYVWDMNTRSCVHRFSDDGCLNGLSISASANGQFIATGSCSGVVNVYSTSSCMTSKSPAPLKAIGNLVTSASHVRFSPSSEILCIASSELKNALRLMHLPSLTAFANFPGIADKLSLPLSFDFSPNNGYLSISNDRGCALLYRVKHYSSY